MDVLLGGTMRCVVMGTLFTVCIASRLSPLAVHLDAQSDATVISVAGDVQRPGDYRYEDGMTVGVVLDRAGGLDGEAVHRINVLRRLDGTLLLVPRATTETVLTPGDAIAVQAYNSGHVASSAQKTVERLSEGEFDLIVIAFDEAMRRSVPESLLRAEWQSLQSDAGTFQRQVDVRTEVRGVNHAGIVISEFSRGRVEVRVVFDRDGKITGLSIMSVVP
jgi:hypothetical protein